MFGSPRVVPGLVLHRGSFGSAYEFTEAGEATTRLIFDISSYAGCSGGPVFLETGEVVAMGSGDASQKGTDRTHVLLAIPTMYIVQAAPITASKSSC